MARKHEMPPKLKSAAKRLTPLLVVFVLIVGMLPVLPVSASQIYGHYIYIDGELAFSIMSSDGASDVQITCKENSVEVYLSDLNSTRSYAISGDGFLGLHIFEDAITPLIPLNTPTVYAGAEGDNKYTYFYTVRDSGGSSGSGGTEVRTYSTYFAVGDDPYYSTDPAAGTCPAITLKVLSDGFQLLNASGSVLKTYTYTGSDVFTGVRLDQDDGFTDVVEKLYSPGESVVCGGVDHTCSFTLSIVTEAVPEYTLRIYVDGILKYTGSAENKCPTISIVPRSTGHLDILAGTSTGADIWAVSPPGLDYEFLGLSLSSGASAADFLLDQKAQFGGSASDATFYLYSVWTAKAVPVCTIPAGTWLANRTLSECPSGLAGTSIPFVFTTASESLASSVASVYWNSAGTQLFFDDQSVYYYSSPFDNVGWHSERHRLITTSASQEVPADFYAWFSSNFTVASASDTTVSQLSGSLYHRTERIQIYGTSLVGSYTMTFSFDGEKTIVSAFQDDLVVWTETLSVDDEYEYITLLLNTGNGVSTITLNSGDTHTTDVLTSDCTFTVRYGEYVDYSDYSGFGVFIRDVLGGFLGFSILPGLTFGGLLAVFVVLGIVKLFFSK